MATDRYEFETTWWNYNFSQLYMTFWIALATVGVNLLLDWTMPTDGGGGIRRILGWIAGVVVITMGGVVVRWFKVRLFGGRRPWIVIEPKGRIVADLPQAGKEEWHWSEVGPVRIKGRILMPRIEVTLMREGILKAYKQIDYYLFPPEQRREIIALLKRAANENGGGPAA